MRVFSFQKYCYIIVVVIDGVFVEDYDVLSERVCFVREDVFYLVQFFVQGGGTGFCGRSFFYVEYFFILVDEVVVVQADDFYIVQGIRGKVWGRKERGCLFIWVFVVGFLVGEKREQSRYLGGEG